MPATIHASPVGTRFPSTSPSAGPTRARLFLVQVIPTASALAVAAASFALSYVALRDVAARTHAVPANLAWMVPVCVDGAVLAASATAWAGSLRGKRMDPIALLVAGTLLTLSVAVNISHAGPSAMAKTLAAVPPVSLLACLELVAGAYRREVLAGREKDVPGPTCARPHPYSRLVLKRTTTAPAPAPRKASATGATYEAVLNLARSHVEAGGELADTTLAPTIAARLGVSASTARKHLGVARRELRGTHAA